MRHCPLPLLALIFSLCFSSFSTSAQQLGVSVLKVPDSIIVGQSFQVQYQLSGSLSDAWIFPDTFPLGRHHQVLEGIGSPTLTVADSSELLQTLSYHFIAWQPTSLYLPSFQIAVVGTNQQFYTDSILLQPRLLPAKELLWAGPMPLAIPESWSLPWYLWVLNFAVLIALAITGRWLWLRRLRARKRHQNPFQSHLSAFSRVLQTLPIAEDLHQQRLNFHLLYQELRCCYLAIINLDDSAIQSTTQWILLHLSFPHFSSIHPLLKSVLSKIDSARFGKDLLSPLAQQQLLASSRELALEVSSWQLFHIQHIAGMKHTTDKQPVEPLITS